MSISFQQMSKALLRDWPKPYKAASRDEDGHWHDWQVYIGFREAYKFCTKCDKKVTNDEHETPYEP